MKSFITTRPDHYVYTYRVEMYALHVCLHLLKVPSTAHVINTQIPTLTYILILNIFYNEISLLLFI